MKFGARKRLACHVVFFVVNLALRLPALFLQETPPHVFCDEAIFMDYGWEMSADIRPVFEEFRSGGLNVWPAVFVGKLCRILLAGGQAYTAYFFAMRVLFPGVLSSLACLVMMEIARLLSPRASAFLWMGFVYTLSPMALAVSRYFYPDHYYVFFCALVLYYGLLVLRDGPAGKWFVPLGISYGLAVSSKFPGILLGLPIALVAGVSVFGKVRTASEASRALRAHLGTLVGAALCAAGIFLALNYSIFFRWEKFLQDYHFNSANYRAMWRPVGMAFCAYGLFVVSWGFAGVGLMALGTYGLRVQKKSGVLSLLYLFPIFLILFLGNRNVVTHRNLMVALPFALTLAGLGADRLFHGLGDWIAAAGPGRSRAGRILLASLAGLAVLGEPVFRSAAGVLHDFDAPTQGKVSRYLRAKIPRGATIGINESCSGPSPAEGGRYLLVQDPDGSTGPDYLLLNGWWPSPLSPAFTAPIAAQWHYRYLHYRNFNAAGFLEKRVGYRNYAGLVPEGYVVLEEFSGGGPDYVLLRKGR